MDPWVRKIHRRRAPKTTPIFMPGESHEQSLAGCGPQGCKKLTWLKWLSTWSWKQDIQNQNVIRVVNSSFILGALKGKICSNLSPWLSDGVFMFTWHLYFILPKPLFYHYTFIHLRPFFWNNIFFLPETYTLNISIGEDYLWITLLFIRYSTILLIINI